MAEELGREHKYGKMYVCVLFGFFKKSYSFCVSHDINPEEIHWNT